MNVIITGSTGMVGKGVLLECLEDDRIESILLVNRKSVGISHPKIKEIFHTDFFNITPIEDQLKGYDACFFCMGITSVGISKEQYYHITYDITVHFAHTLLPLNPQMLFIYVSGTGTSSLENSRMNWANVKGKVENEILSMPFKNSFMFRPGYIQPMKGIKSATRLYNAMYAIFKPLYPLLKALSPNMATTTINVGKAMINAVIKGYEKQHLENRDINILASK